jgi:hypothetical protein
MLFRVVRPMKRSGSRFGYFVQHILGLRLPHSLDAGEMVAARGGRLHPSSVANLLRRLKTQST